VKYLGLYCVLAGAAVMALRRPRWRRLLAFGAAAAAALAVAYGYLWWRTGDPLFPYFGGLFGNGWRPIEPPATNRDRVLRTLMLPWSAVLHRDLAGQLPPLSPALLLALPLLAWDVARSRRLRGGTALLLGYLVLLAFMPGSAHYLLVILPLWALLAAAATLEALRAVRGAPLSTPGAALLAVVLALPAPLYGGFWAARAGSVPTSAAGRETYLAATHRGYDLLAWADRHSAPGAIVYGLDCENLHAFARGRLLGEWQGPYAFARVRPYLANPPQLHGELRAMGAQYLLLPREQAAGLRNAGAAGLFALLRGDAGFELWQVR
ncbi:MAG TPA: hypothetical protein VGV61_12450, partial [Thermoanaerobaculia bacterium]|nr:hypothetical protein [Thermoanaerobaculia bacterium]